MASTIHQSEPEVVETGRGDPPHASPSEVTDDVARAETCSCDECQAPARDEMWSRWA